MSVCIDYIDYTIQSDGFLWYRNGQRTWLPPQELMPSISLAKGDCEREFVSGGSIYNRPSIFNMSDKEDVPTPGDVSINSEYATPENSSFRNASLLGTCCTPIKSSVLEKSLQQETEEYSTPSFEKFLQWRCDQPATPVTPEVSYILNKTHVDTPNVSPCDTSLLAQMSKLCLFTPKNKPVSTPANMEMTLVNLECTPGKSLDPSTRISHGKRRGTEESSLDQLIEMGDEFADGDVTSSDYSTMLVDRDSSSTVDRDSSSKITYDDSSSDRLSSRETQSGATRVSVTDLAEEAETKKLRDLADVESTRLLDNSSSASLYDQPSTSRHDEVYKTNTFDTFNAQYNQNVVFTRRYVEEMVMKKQDAPSGCFRCFWSPRRIVRTSPCRLFRESKRIKTRDPEDRGSAWTASSESVATETSNDRERKSPSLKLRLGRVGEKREVRIPERANPGKMRFTLIGGKNGRSMIVACRAAITTIPTLNAVCFCIGPTNVTRYILWSAVPRRRPPVTCETVIASTQTGIYIFFFFLPCIILTSSISEFQTQMEERRFLLFHGINKYARLATLAIDRAAWNISIKVESQGTNIIIEFFMYRVRSRQRAPVGFTTCGCFFSCLVRTLKRR